MSRARPDASRDGTRRAVAVAALGRQIVVRTAAPAEGRAVNSMLRAMRVPLRPGPLARLTLRRVRDGYVVSGGPDTGTVDASLSDALWRLRNQVIVLLMNARPDLLWLHAAGVARGGHAVLIAGPSGSGKSTLAAVLISHGFEYLGDDPLPLDPQTGFVHALPMAPSMRRGPRRCLTPEEVRTLPKEDVPLTSDRIASAPVRVGLIVFPRYTPDCPGTEPVSPAHAALEMLQHCLDFARHREHAVRAIGALASARPATRLRFDDPDRAVGLIVQMLSAGGGVAWSTRRGEQFSGEAGRVPDPGGARPAPARRRDWPAGGGGDRHAPYVGVNLPGPAGGLDAQRVVLDQCVAQNVAESSGT